MKVVIYGLIPKSVIQDITKRPRGYSVTASIFTGDVQEWDRVNFVPGTLTVETVEEEPNER